MTEYQIEEGLPPNVLPTITAEVISQVHDLAQKHVSQTSISKIVGISRKRVSAILAGKPERGPGGFSQKEKWQKVRDEEYSRGFASTPSLIDALCIGLYLGEGAWHDERWLFVNSNKEYVRLMKDWATRAKQLSDAFKLHIKVSSAVEIPESEILYYWSDLGIPVDQTRIYRITPKSSKNKTEHRIPYGTVALFPKKNGLHLFEYMRGQRDKLLGA